MSERSIYNKDIPITPADVARGFVTIDVYRILRAYKVTDQNIGHAIKKLLCPGQRGGGKTMEQDVREAGWTIRRWEEMNAEDAKAFCDEHAAPTAATPTTPEET